MLDISSEVRELKRKLREAKTQEKRSRKEEKRSRKMELKDGRQRAREESRLRKETLQEEKAARKEIRQHKKEKLPDKEDGKEKKQGMKRCERAETEDFLPFTWASSYLPIQKIKNGIIYTTDHRFVKVVEILPINFLLRSPGEQRNIISSFLSYLKISPVRMQFKVISRKADIAEYLKRIQEEIDHEQDARCRILQEDYMQLIRNVGTKEAITRRFFLVFEYSSYNRSKNPSEK